MSPLTQLFYEISYGGCRRLTHANEVIEYAQLITELEADDHDTREALALLARFEDFSRYTFLIATA